MKILVTGSNGMLGSSLCRLYHKKHEVYAIHRDPYCFTMSTKDQSLDLRKIQLLKEFFKKNNPDLVIHCAGLTNVDENEKNKNSLLK